jgi:plasmid stabilization system protein ParE
MDWLKETWAYLVVGGGILAAVVLTIRNTYGAERDRQALKQASLEADKLRLEIARLRNTPEIVAERRAIYERLRTLLRALTGTTIASLAQVSDIHDIRHDAEYRFPPDVAASIKALIADVVTLHVAHSMLGNASPSPADQQRYSMANLREESLKRLLDYESRLIETFRPYLSL